MSDQAAREFLAKVNADEALQKRVLLAPKSFLALGKELGHEFTKEELAAEFEASCPEGEFTWLGRKVRWETNLTPAQRAQYAHADGLLLIEPSEAEELADWELELVSAGNVENCELPSCCDE